MMWPPARPFSPMSASVSEVKRTSRLRLDRYPNGHRGRISGQDGRQIVSRAKVAPHSLLREVGKRAKLRERLASARVVEHQTRHFDRVFIERGFHLAFLGVTHHHRNRQPGKADA